MARKKECILACALLLGVQLSMGGALAAPATQDSAPVARGAAPVAQKTPEWAYGALSHLIEEGYLKLPERPLPSYSRAQIAKMTAAALQEVERTRTGTLASVYGRISRLVVMDTAQLKMAKEQEEFAQKRFSSARRKAENATELYVRRSIQGQNRLEVMKPLKEKSDEAQKQLEMAARDYAEASSRVKHRQRMLDYAKARQENLLAAMSGTSTTPGAPASSGFPFADQLATIPPSVLDDAAKLRAEFMSELDDSGYLDEEASEQQLSSNLPVKDVPDQRFKVDAELRLDSGHSSGEHGIGDRTRLRSRIYPDYNIDGNWHAIGMIEWEKTLTGPQGSDDGKLRLDRYYLSGDVGAVHTDAGAYGSFMAEGNIYDSKFKGIRLSAGDPVRYTAEYGRVSVDDMDRSYDLVASYDTADYGVDGGFYRFDWKSGDSRSIAMANYRRRLGIFDFGAMALRGKDQGSSDGNGFVLSLAYQPLNSWKPKSSSYWLKYYRQPASTYIRHTMNGMADPLSIHGGFRGWGMGYAYNPAQNWTMGLELYHLQDIDYGHTSNTVWGFVSRYFANYTE